MGLSPRAETELNSLLNVTAANQQYNKIHNPDYFKEHMKTDFSKSSLSKDSYDSNHARRFQEHFNMSSSTVDELKVVMDLIWRVLYDPNAYKDPSYDKQKADKLAILFQNGPPKCCSEHLYKRAARLP